MPYSSSKDLPAGFAKYAPKGKRAAVAAFNAAVYDQGLDESRAFAVAHTAAKRASRRASGRRKES